MELFFLVFISCFLVVSQTMRARDARRLEEATKPLLASQKKAFDSLQDSLTAIMTQATVMTSLAKDLMFEEERPAVTATRVYAAFLQNGAAARLHMLPATSVEEFTDKSQAILGPGWSAKIIEYLDVHSGEKIVYMPATKTEKKVMGIEQGVYFLEMVKDKFATTRQRSTMDGIITSYKKAYELS